MIEGTEGQWLEDMDGSELTRAVEALRKVTPGRGSSLYKAFQAANQLEPKPDNIYLLTDGLPTQGANIPGKTESVKPSRRADFLQQSSPRTAQSRAGEYPAVPDGWRPVGCRFLLAVGDVHARLAADAGEGLAVMPKRRDMETFSLSFLDAITCGFGAVILLLVLIKIYEPMTIERSREDLDADCGAAGRALRTARRNHGAQP